MSISLVLPEVIQFFFFIGNDLSQTSIFWQVKSNSSRLVNSQSWLEMVIKWMWTILKFLVNSPSGNQSNPHCNFCDRKCQSQIHLLPLYFGWSGFAHLVIILMTLEVPVVYQIVVESNNEWPALLDWNLKQIYSEEHWAKPKHAVRMTLVR